MVAEVRLCKTFCLTKLNALHRSRNFLLNQPVLFGTWDGVFTTVMVNIFGIIVFLRMGWIVVSVVHLFLKLHACYFLTF